MGIGVPQYRCRLTPQSFKRNVTLASPKPLAAATSCSFFCAWAQLSPSYSPEFTSTPSSERNGSSASSALRIRGRNHPPDRNRILRRKFEVACIVARHAHDCARAVIQQHVIRHPDRHPLAVIRIDGEVSRRHAMLLDRAHVASLARLLLLLKSCATCFFRPESASAIP